MIREVTENQHEGDLEANAQRRDSCSLGELAPKRRIFVGLDVGKGQHEVAAIPAERFCPPNKPDSWQRVPSLRFGTDLEGFQRLEAYLQGLSIDPEDFIIFCEPTGGYYGHTVLAYLLAKNYAVSQIPNRSTKAFRERLHAGLAKTDAIDARVMARMAYLSEVVGEEYSIEPVFSAVTPNLEIRAMTNRLWHMQKETNRHKNQLQQLLTVTFPEITKFYPTGLNARSALFLLSRFSTPQEIADASIEDLYDVIVRGARDKTRARKLPQLKELARASIGITNSPHYLWRQSWLARQLLRMEESRDELKEYLRDAVADHPYHRILSSLPVSGTIWSATLIGVIVDIGRFNKGPRSFKAYMGFVPSIKRSGISGNSARLTYSGVRATRRVLFQMVLTLIGPSGGSNVFKDYYLALVGRGMPRLKAIGHVAGKLATVIYACLRSNSLYDEARHRKECGKGMAVKEVPLD